MADLLTQKDAIANLCMHHFGLPRLPQWTWMDSITSEAMQLRYLPVEQDQVPDNKEELPVRSIAFDPPLQSMMDTRQRLVEMSAKSTEANTAFLNRRQDIQWFDIYNIDVLSRTLYMVVMNPVVLVAFFSLVYMYRHSKLALYMLLPMIPPLTWASIVWLSQRWRNAPALPASVFGLPWWAFRTLFLRTLPKLNEETWKTQLVVLTGGARGLGATLALRLAEKGAKVITLDVAQSTIKHENVLAYNCDVSKYTNLVPVARSILQRHGTPTILINNTGVRSGRPITELTAADMARTMDTNVMSNFWILKEFLPSMLEKRRGHIVTVSSMMGYQGFAQLCDYTASKHALIGLHDVLRRELDSIYRQPNIRTTLVCPGHIADTTLFEGIQYNKLARFLTPTTSADVIASMIVDALERQESTFVAAPWHVPWTPFLAILPSFLRDGIAKVRCLYGWHRSPTRLSEQTIACRRSPRAESLALSFCSSYKYAFFIVYKHHKQTNYRAPSLGAGVLGESEVRTNCLVAREEFLRLVILNTRVHNDIVARLPVGRSGNPMLVADLERVDHSDNLVKVATGGCGVRDDETNHLVRVYHEYIPHGERHTLGIHIGGVKCIKHVIQRSDLAFVVTNDGEVDASVRNIVDVLDPLLVRRQVVGREANHLDAALPEVGIPARNLAKLRRTHGGEVCGMRKQHTPRVAKPLVEMDRALRGLSGKVGSNRAEAEVWHGNGLDYATLRA